MPASARLASLVAVGLASALAFGSGDARAFCRTLTCPPPAGYPIVDSDAGLGACTPPTADFEVYCATKVNPPVTAILPLWWRNACVSYDLQQDAGPGIPLSTATSIVDMSFAAWMNARCSTGSPSITPMDLGPVSCGNVEYNSDQGNQHVIVFREGAWPYDSNNALGLTTVTYDPDTGEIYDADTEINATPDITLSTLPVPLSQTYDFQSIMTHEAGHFLGMAHATDTAATMYYSYTIGSTSMRTLTQDDIDGICAIYSPDGTRNVDPSIDGGSIPEDSCDPTPRHGFSTTCGGPISHGCDISRSGSRPGSDALMFVGFAGAVAVLTRTRSRRRSI